MKNLNDGNFRNFVGDPFLNAAPGRYSPTQIRAMGGQPYVEEPIIPVYQQRPVDTSLLNASGSKKGIIRKNFCGYGADGEPVDTNTAAPAPSAPISTPITASTGWQYAKTALAVIGIYVVAKFVYVKWIKK